MLKFLYINRIKLYYYILIFIGVYGFFLNVSLGDMDFNLIFVEYVIRKRINCF